MIRAMASDELIARLRERAADPERRVESRPSTFPASLRAMAPGKMAKRIADVRADLGRLVAGVRAGHIETELVARAERMGDVLRERALRDLPARATPAAVAEAESLAGVELPATLRRAYLEIANGGFGPGGGIMPVEGVAARYRALRTESPGPEGCEWPEALLPVVDHDQAYTCVDARTGRVIAFDLEDLLEEWDPDAPDARAARRGWKRCFREIAPTIETWLERWVISETVPERMAKRIAEANLREARAARARIAALTPEQRAAMGLPEVGWERVIWGGLGLDEPDQSSRRE
jgi:hypothetical protein